jgi:hypothetical protein
MTSQGSAQARLQLFIRAGNVPQADLAARELGSLSLSEALSLCLLYEVEGDTRFERAFQRCRSRVRREKALRHEQVELLSAAAGALSTSFRPIALDVLLTACRRLGMPQPTRPPYQSNSRAAHCGQLSEN